MFPYKRFKKKYKIFHLMIVSLAIVMIWRGFWGILDYYLVPDYPLISYVLGILIAFLILYLDDFHLKELE